MSVDNLRQEQAEAASAIASAQRSLNAAINEENNAPDDKKESVQQKIEDIKFKLIEASERSTLIGQELRSAEGYERKEETAKERAEEEAKIKQDEAEAKKKLEEEKAKDTTQPNKPPASTTINGEELVRSDAPMTQDEILTRMLQIQQAAAAMNTSAENERTVVVDSDTTAELAQSSGAGATAVASVTGTASASGSTTTSADEGLQVKATAGSSQANT